MTERWLQLLRALGEFRRLLKRQQPILIGPSQETGSAKAALADCRTRLVEVLLPESEYSRLVKQLNNAHAYYMRGELGAAHWEAVQAHRRANALRRLYA